MLKGLGLFNTWEINLKTFEYRSVFTVQGSTGNVATEEQSPLCEKSSSVKVDLPKT